MTKIRIAVLAVDREDFRHHVRSKHPKMDTWRESSASHSHADISCFTVDNTESLLGFEFDRVERTQKFICDMDADPRKMALDVLAISRVRR